MLTLANTAITGVPSLAGTAGVSRSNGSKRASPTPLRRLRHVKHALYPTELTARAVGIVAQESEPLRNVCRPAATVMTLKPDDWLVPSSVSQPSQTCPRARVNGTPASHVSSQPELDLA
jgi:hypothetical protein